MLAAIEARRVKQEARAAAIERGELAVEDPRERRLREQKEAAAKAKAETRAAKKEGGTRGSLAEARKNVAARRRSQEVQEAQDLEAQEAGSPTLISRLSRRLSKAGSSIARTASSLSPSCIK